MLVGLIVFHKINRGYMQLWLASIQNDPESDKAIMQNRVCSVMGETGWATVLNRGPVDLYGGYYSR